MLTLYLILHLFTAEVSEYRGDGLIRHDTVTCYYKFYEKDKMYTFYVTYGGGYHQGRVEKPGESIFPLRDQEDRDWMVYFITPKHLILDSGNRTIIIRGL